jgi:predicted transcriptional regulator
LAPLLEALECGETPEPFSEITFHDPDDIHRVTGPKNLELLRAVVTHEPGSIRETARLVDRDVSQVHRNLGELEDLHLIDLVEDGQSKRPQIWYDAIELDLQLHSSCRDATVVT